MMMDMENSVWWQPVLRWCVTAGVAVWSAVLPGMPYLLLCTGFVLLDCWSACALGRRVAKLMPEKALADAGKVKSWRLGKVVRTLAEIYAVLLLVHFAQICMPQVVKVDLRQVVASAVCGWQFWSYLENKASCNGARWASLARRFLADKTSRHLNINICDDEKD